MRSAVPIAVFAIVFALGLPAGDATAAAAKKADSSTAKSQTSKSSLPAKGKARRSTAKPSAMVAPLPELSQSQLDVAQLVQIGRANCEFAQSVSIEPDPTRFGAFLVKFMNKVYKMVPEETATGAVRLQDAGEGIVWLQIPVKSMLMNMNVGQRMVDACTQPAQRVAQSQADTRARAAAARLAAPPAAASAEGAASSPMEQDPQPLPLLRK